MPEPVAKKEKEKEKENEHQNGNLTVEGSVEKMFEGKEVPKWTEQLTPRALVVSIILGFFITYICMRLTLQQGESIVFNLFSAPIGFLVIKVWTTFMETIGFHQRPFTRQENTVLYASLLACTSITLNGGFGSYLLAMNSYMGITYTDPADTKTLAPSWIIVFLFITSFIGIFTVVPLSKVLLLRHKLKYPSGMSAGNLINCLHATNGTPITRHQIRLLLKAIVWSIAWHFFGWFYSSSPTCGFQNIPAFGMILSAKGYHFSFNAGSIGTGMICSPTVGLSMLAGGIISWAFLWPYVESKEGIWYEKQPFISLTGLSGYVVSVTIAIALGDGIFHMGIVILQVCYEMYMRKKQKHIILHFAKRSGPELSSMSYDDRRRTNLYVENKVPTRVALGGYHVAAAYVLAPLLSFSNAYCTGLTDWTLNSAFSKFAILVFGAWTSGAQPGSVIAALASSGITTAVANTASDLMADFRTGYMTMTSPRAMFVAQIFGTAMGCIMAPICYMFFAAASPGLLTDTTEYPAEYASTYRVMAESSVKGFKMLPKNSVTLAVGAFFSTIGINILREVARSMNWRVYRFIPSLIPMAISFFTGASISFDVILGSLIAYLWRRKNKRHAELFMAFVGCGMIIGEAFSPVIDNLMSYLSLTPPYCMRFLGSETAEKVAGFLAMIP
ncbi:Oligopeptide transporter OPT protein [Dioscorea alata]|uniref:Oligopeptide transporter OPT protein n=1 Tax=Dioscorea alata TaxID=55571 RepID=A0ACB7V6X1_DIOAL|nr:Oligopeptide transporter OPT protein [Dioscorea alata]